MAKSGYPEGPAPIMKTSTSSTDVIGGSDRGTLVILLGDMSHGSIDVKAIRLGSRKDYRYDSLR